MGWLQLPHHKGTRREIPDVAAQSSHFFFSLFAFALNNQQAVSVYFFFGTLWQAPLVLVVLLTFAFGLGTGVLMMMPRWWKKRRAARLNHPAAVGENPSTMHHGL